VQLTEARETKPNKKVWSRR